MTEVKSPKDEISLRGEHLTAYKSFLIYKGNVTLGLNLTCYVPLNYIYKTALQIIERGFLTYFVYYMNMDITYS